MRIVCSWLLQDRVEQRRLRGLPGRLHDGAPKLGDAGSLRGGAGLLRERRWRLPAVPGGLLRADHRHVCLPLVPCGRDLAGGRQQPESVQLLAGGLDEVSDRNQLLHLCAGARERQHWLVRAMPRRLLLHGRRGHCQFLHALLHLARRQHRRSRLCLQRGLRCERKHLPSVRGRTVRERGQLRAVSREQQQRRRKRRCHRLPVHRRLQRPRRRALRRVRSRQVQDTWFRSV